MSVLPENIPWELLARYVAGECTPQEVTTLSARIEAEPAVADALAEMLLQAVVVRDDAEAHPERVRAAVPAVAKRSQWLSPAVFAMAAALVAAFTAIWFLAFSAEDRDILRITALDGAVRWTGRGGEVRDSLKSSESLPGGLLETISDDSTLVVAFDDGTSLTLLGHTSATFSADGQKTVHLRAGSLSADVRPQPGGHPLLIHTPTARLEVLGTRFEVDSDPANTRLTVNEGRVRMTRLMDGRVAEVPAQHEVLVSLADGVEMPVERRKQPEVLWRSDIAAGPASTQGRWLPAEDEKPARIAAEPVFVPKSSRGPVTIHRVGLTLPWQTRANLQIRPDSMVRLRGHATKSATLEVMLACMKTTGGYAGNWFQQRSISAGEWQMELPVSAFRHWRADAKNAPQEPLELRQMAIYTIGTDAALEVESVEVLGAK